MDIKNNIKEIKENIEKSLEGSGRSLEDITIVAVSKNVDSTKVVEANGEGLINFGENRVQEFLKKYEELDLELSWHMIGHLQRNKVKYLMRMENCKMIESIDSLRLAKEVNKRAKKNERVIPVLVEINIAGDENKFGIMPDKAEEFLKKIIKLKNLKLEGLMTVLPYLDDSEKLRCYFKQMKTLFDKLSEDLIQLNELSMGMTNDYQIAIEEGATIVRVGRALFGEREY